MAGEIPVKRSFPGDDGTLAIFACTLVSVFCDDVASDSALSSALKHLAVAKGVFPIVALQTIPALNLNLGDEEFVSTVKLALTLFPVQAIRITPDGQHIQRLTRGQQISALLDNLVSRRAGLSESECVLALACFLQSATSAATGGGGAASSRGVGSRGGLTHATSISSTASGSGSGDPSKPPQTAAIADLYRLSPSLRSLARSPQEITEAMYHYRAAYLAVSRDGKRVSVLTVAQAIERVLDAYFAETRMPYDAFLLQLLSDHAGGVPVHILVSPQFPRLHRILRRAYALAGGAEETEDASAATWSTQSDGLAAAGGFDDDDGDACMAGARSSGPTGAAASASSSSSSASSAAAPPAMSPFTAFACALVTALLRRDVCDSVRLSDDGTSVVLTDQNWRIRRQVEFYFGDENYGRDKYLRDLVADDPDGYVSLSVICSFRRLQTLRANVPQTAAALAGSSVVEVSPDGQWARKRIARTARTGSPATFTPASSSSSSSRGAPLSSSSSLSDAVSSVMDEFVFDVRAAIGAISAARSRATGSGSSGPVSPSSSSSSSSSSSGFGVGAASSVRPQVTAFARSDSDPCDEEPSAPVARTGSGKGKGDAATGSAAAAATTASSSPSALSASTNSQASAAAGGTGRPARPAPSPPTNPYAVVASPAPTASNAVATTGTGTGTSGMQASVGGGGAGVASGHQGALGAPRPPTTGIASPSAASTASCTHGATDSPSAGAGAGPRTNSGGISSRPPLSSLPTGFVRGDRSERDIASDMSSIDDAVADPSAPSSLRILLDDLFAGHHLGVDYPLAHMLQVDSPSVAYVRAVLSTASVATPAMPVTSSASASASASSTSSASSSSAFASSSSSVTGLRMVYPSSAPPSYLAGLPMVSVTDFYAHLHTISRQSFSRYLLRVVGGAVTEEPVESGTGPAYLRALLDSGALEGAVNVGALAVADPSTGHEELFLVKLGAMPPMRPLVSAQLAPPSAAASAGGTSATAAASALAGDPFSVMTFNVLADGLCSPEAYDYTHPLARRWDERRDRIVREVASFMPSVLCLQEVQGTSVGLGSGDDPDNHAHWFSTVLAELGYDGCYRVNVNDSRLGARSGRWPRIGVSLYWRTDVWETAFPGSVKRVNYSSCVYDACREVPASRSQLCLPQGAVVASLRHKASDQVAMFAGTHISCRWEQPYIQITQAHALVREMEAMLGPALVNKVPCIIAGDFNIQPGSGLYTLMTSGGIPASHPDLQTGSSLRLPFPAPRQQMQLRSTYRSALGAELPFTNFAERSFVLFSAVLDYIFYSPILLNPTSVLGALPAEVASEERALPSRRFPSDHIPLYAEYRFGRGAMTATEAAPLWPFVAAQGGGSGPAHHAHGGGHGHVHSHSHGPGHHHSPSSASASSAAAASSDEPTDHAFGGTSSSAGGSDRHGHLHYHDASRGGGGHHSGDRHGHHHHGHRGGHRGTGT